MQEVHNQRDTGLGQFPVDVNEVRHLVDGQRLVLPGEQEFLKLLVRHVVVQRLFDSFRFGRLLGFPELFV